MSDLLEYIHTTHEISCDECGKTSRSYWGEDWMAEEEFEKEGYRPGDDDNVLCKECAEKLLNK